LRRFTRTAAIVVMLVLLLNLFGGTRGAAASGTATYTGVIGGATFLVEVPSPWNGVLVLYSHGYVIPGSPNPAQDAGDPFTEGVLLSEGFALAGSSYSTTGWAVQQALGDQIALLDWFTAHVAHPQKTIAWGHSLGGLITAGLIQRHPERFDAALPMCGAVAGGLGVWNQALDSAFTFKTLLAPSAALQVVNITNPPVNLNTAEVALAGAQATPQGRARIALVSAFGDIPGWFIPGSAEPAANDYTSREANQFLWAQQVDFPFVFAFRAELEARAGGNPSWNTGVNFHEQLAKSVDREEVRALYEQAGLSLEKDMKTLENAQRIAAKPSAVDYLAHNITIDSELHMPVLTMHTTGDGLVTVQNEQAYASAVADDESHRLLREVFVHRAGHCAFTPAETLTAFQALLTRMSSGHWPSTKPADLNAAAALLGPLNNFPPSFLPYRPSVFLRPFDN
jgi:pimeloyl-ACP methyl ester carboxylesterase